MGLIHERALIFFPRDVMIWLLFERDIYRFGFCSTSRLCVRVRLRVCVCVCAYVRDTQRAREGVGGGGMSVVVTTLCKALR